MLTRRDVLRFTGVAPAVLRGANRKAGDKPNLLFLWTDQQRADTMAAYGQPGYRVPTINRLAARSIVFDRCYVTQPVCTPSRSSVMTGLWPHQSGCRNNNVALRPETKTLPELLGDDDYQTGYMGKWHLGDEIFAQHGFRDWVGIEDGYSKHYSEGHDRSARSGYHHFLEQQGYQPDSNGRFSRGFACRRPAEHCKPAFLTQNAERFVLANRSEPWMLHVNFLEPHSPFFGPYDDLHSTADAPPPKNCETGPVEREPEFYADRRGGNTSLHNGDRLPLTNRQAWERFNRNYAGLCAQVDQAVARILWALESSGQRENTIIVYTSDHGEMAGSHDLTAKRVMYEESMRVPLLLHVPFRNQKPSTFERPMSQIDLVPTLLELLGQEPPDALPGKSLLPVLSGKAEQEEYTFCEWHGRDREPSGRTVVSADGWKMALYDEGNCLLFNRRDDPFELRNLYYMSEHRSTIQRLRTAIDKWQSTVDDTQRLPG
jgi:arylsulfatase A-like enzyme